MNFFKGIYRSIRSLFFRDKDNPVTTPGTPPPDPGDGSDEQGLGEEGNDTQVRVYVALVKDLKRRRRLIVDVQSPDLSALDIRLDRMSGILAKKEVTLGVGSRPSIVSDDSIMLGFEELLGDRSMVQFHLRREAEKSAEFLALRQKLFNQLDKIDVKISDGNLDGAKALIDRLTPKIDESDLELKAGLASVKRKYRAGVKEFERRELEKELLRIKEREKGRLQEKKRREEEQDTLRKSLIEHGSDYHYTLLEDNSPMSAFKILKYKENFGLYDDLDRGLALLGSDEELRQYLFSYGYNHSEKLREAFLATVSPAVIDHALDEIEIFDWGCGQALGSISLIDRLKTYKRKHQNVRMVTLIDPGLPALKRAALHVSLALEDDRKVRPVNKYINQELVPKDLQCSKSSVKYHIFSNIIDVDGIDVRLIRDLILENCRGLNYIVCVGPRFGETPGSIAYQKDEKMEDFSRSFRHLDGFEEVSWRENGRDWRPGKSWTRKECIIRFHN